MHISEDGLHVLKYYESCRLEAYPDPATGGEPITIGWGSTYPGLKLGETITQQRADELLAERLSEEFEPGVRRLLHSDPTQGQFDALVCFAYNVGLDIDPDTKAEGLGDSTLLRMHLAGDYKGAANQFLLWTMANGKSMWGLRRRRAAERALYQGLNAAMAINIGDKTP